MGAGGEGLGTWGFEEKAPVVLRRDFEREVDFRFEARCLAIVAEGSGGGGCGGRCLVGSFED